MLVSTLGLEGITAQQEEHVLVAQETTDFSEYLSRLVNGEFSAMGEAARLFVASFFDWNQSLPRVVALLNSGERSALQSPAGSL